MDKQTQDLITKKNLIELEISYYNSIIQNLYKKLNILDKQLYKSCDHKWVQSCASSCGSAVYECMLCGCSR